MKKDDFRWWDWSGEVVGSTSRPEMGERMKGVPDEEMIACVWAARLPREVSNARRPLTRSEKKAIGEKKIGWKLGNI